MVLSDGLLDVLKDIYNQYKEYQIKDFDVLVAKEMVEEFEHKLKQTYIEGKILNTISNKYPQYIYRWEYCGDGGRWLAIYNVEEEKEDELSHEFYDIFDAINVGYEFDIMPHTVDKETTAEHYSHLLENKENK